MKSEIAEITIDDVLATCEGAYSTRTTKGYRADLSIFIGWCAARDVAWLPADPASVAAFIDEQSPRHRISTIKRRLCAIAFAHRMNDLPSPTEANVVRLAVRRASRQTTSRPEQKRGLTQSIRAQIIAACPGTLAGRRDAALISVGYDTLCRSSELAAMRVGDVSMAGRRGGTILVRRTKADITGEGRIAHLSPDTVTHVRTWLAAAGLTGGPLFRSLHLHRVSDTALETSSIRRLIKRATRRAGLAPDLTAGLSGHSMRIGAAQDMMVAGFDALAIMQAGGWKSANVVLRYVENAATRDLHERRWARLAEMREGAG